MKEGPCANSALKVVLGPYSPTSKFGQHMKHEKLYTLLTKSCTVLKFFLGWMILELKCVQSEGHLFILCLYLLKDIFTRQSRQKIVKSAKVGFQVKARSC